MTDNNITVELSIPYWDFLVLNLSVYFVKNYIRSWTFNSLLGFSSFESGYRFVPKD